MSVKLSKELIQRQDSEGEHERLIAIVAGTEVSFPECMSEGYLSDFLAVAKNPEFGLSGENLLPGNNACPPAAVDNAVVLKDGFFA
jgi:hypothetical protein